MALQVVTANRLQDGRVVYLTGAGGWSERLGDGEVAADEAETARLMATAARAEAEQLVVAAYLIEVTGGPGDLEPVRYREVIRAQGPSVRSDLGKQAGWG